MAGGNYQSQNKVRPGAYMNTVTNDLVATGLDSNGAVIIPLALNWGETGKFIKVTSATNFTALFGSALKDIKPIREAFKATGQVTVYNVNGEGVKATATSGTFVATAKHGGTDGNKISVKVAIGLPSTATVKTFYAGAEVDSQVVATSAELVPNAYVSFSGALPESDATVTLATGSTVVAMNETYATVAAGLDTQDFKVIAIGTEDATIKALFTLKIKELREQSGKNVSFVTNDYKAADHEGVVSVINGVTLEGNEVLTASDALYFYAAAYANAGTKSLTYTEYPGAIDCERKTNDEIIQALKDGHIIYTFNNDSVVIEQDINTFRSFTVEKNQDFRKNRIVRVKDIIENNTQHVFSKFFIGKVDNNDNGRDLFKTQLIKVVYEPLAKLGAVEYLADEIVIMKGNEKDAVLAESRPFITDAMEKLYMTSYCK